MANPWITSCVKYRDSERNLTRTSGKSERYLGWMEGFPTLKPRYGPNVSWRKVPPTDEYRRTIDADSCDKSDIHYDQE